MDWSEVRERVAAGGNEHTEIVREPGDLAATGRAVCAFANGVGGLLVLGADDDGRFVGVPGDPDRVQERLASFLQTGCSAPVSASPGRHETPAGWVHWVWIPRQRGFEPLGFGGRYWIRRGRNTVEPSPHERQELFNAFGFVRTEEQVLRDTGARDLDLEAFHRFLRAQELETGDDLRNHGVLGADRGRLHTTLYGILAFGRNPQGHRQTRSFLIRCAAYAGEDPSAEVILAGEAGGRLDEQVQRALGWFRSLGHTESYEEGVLRRDGHPVPLPALREAPVNAVVHRDYAMPGATVLLESFSDRVVVTSPGTLPNHMTPANVRAGSRPRSRNEALAHAMVVARLMEGRGRGWLIMRRAMREWGGPEPEIENDEDGRVVAVTLRRPTRRCNS